MATSSNVAIGDRTGRNHIVATVRWCEMGMARFPFVFKSLLGMGEIHTEQEPHMKFPASMIPGMRWARKPARLEWKSVLTLPALFQADSVRYAG